MQRLLLTKGVAWSLILKRGLLVDLALSILLCATKLLDTEGMREFLGPFVTRADSMQVVHV